MKTKDRDMFYQNYNAGAIATPQMPYMNQGMPGQQMSTGQPMMGPPSGYMMNSNMQAFGPNLANQASMSGMANMVPEQMGYFPRYPENDYEERITKCERQLRKLDTRVAKLEGLSGSTETHDEISNDNLYVL